MTFSVVARCHETGMLGLAITSSSPAVAARCAYAQAGVGAVASQNVTDPRLGVRALALLSQGATSDEAVGILVRTAPHMDYRQLLVVDAAGRSAVHSGANALGIWNAARADHVVCGGNLLANPSVPQAMVDAFVGSTGHLVERLLLTLSAGQAAGGEAGPVHSAGLKLVCDVPWPVADLRVDWSDGDPIAELQALWQRYQPQLEDYVTRALDPSAAPSYGVAGDE
ncbi:MAG: DUF1028 domain-containing protein [Pseudomonadota bacterium]